MLPLLGAEGTRKRASVPGGSCVHPPTNAPGGALALRRSGHELPDHAQRLLGLVAEDAVAGVGEDLEPRASDRLGQLVVIGEGGDRVEGAGEDQARAPDRLELAEPVVGESLAAEEVAPDSGRRTVRAIASDRAASGCRAPDAARDDQPRDQVRVADSDAESDDTAEGLAEDNGMLELERAAEVDHVLDPRGEVPPVRRAPVASALAAVVQENDLRGVGERRKGALQQAV